MALRVSDFETVVGSLQAGEEAVGVLPSVVQCSDAPSVASLMVTVCAALYEPAAGVNVGAAGVELEDETLHPAMTKRPAKKAARV